MSSDQTAGLPSLAQKNFNVITGETGTDEALVNSAGTGIDTTLSFSSNDDYTTGTGTGTANDTLLSGKIDSGSGAISFTLNDVAAGTYDLIVYTANNNSPNGLATYVVGSTSYEIQDQTGSDFDGTFLRGSTGPDATTYDTANYVEFDNIVVGSGGSITLTTTNVPGYYSNALNGFQLQAVVPEPSTWALMLVGSVLVLGLSRYRRIS